MLRAPRPQLFWTMVGSASYSATYTVRVPQGIDKSITNPSDFRKKPLRMTGYEKGEQV